MLFLRFINSSTPSFISRAAGLCKDRHFVISSPIVFQAEIENPMDNHTSAYHLWQAFFSHSVSLIGLTRLLFYTFTISYLLLDPVESDGDLHVLVQKVIQ